MDRGLEVDLVDQVGPEDQVLALSSAGQTPGHQRGQDQIPVQPAELQEQTVHLDSFSVEQQVQRLEQGVQELVQMPRQLV